MCVSECPFHQLKSFDSFNELVAQDSETARIEFVGNALDKVVGLVIHAT